MGHLNHTFCSEMKFMWWKLDSKAPFFVQIQDKFPMSLFKKGTIESNSHNIKFTTQKKWQKSVPQLWEHMKPSLKAIYYIEPFANSVAKCKRICKSSLVVRGTIPRKAVKLWLSSSLSHLSPLVNAVLLIKLWRYTVVSTIKLAISGFSSIVFRRTLNLALSIPNAISTTLRAREWRSLKRRSIEPLSVTPPKGRIQ